jgi:hypothetical protein
VAESDQTAHHQPEAVVLDFVNPEFFAAFFFSALRFLLAADALQKTCRFNYAELRDLRRALFTYESIYSAATGSPKIGDGRGSMNHLRFLSS